MSRIAYVNGLYRPHRDAAIHIEDRGFQFADGAYEVVAVADARLADWAPHLDRLERSLGELRIALPVSRRSLGLIAAEVLRRNRIDDGILYIQISRGTARRDHAFPMGTRPSLVMTARPIDMGAIAALAEKGVSVVTRPDQRWRRCDIKSVSLLPNVLAKQTAREAGAYEAWMVDERGIVTEGASTNAWIVDDKDQVITHPVEAAILAGITRQSLIPLIEKKGLTLVERPFTVDEAKAAREAFLTSTTSFVMPVVRIDDTEIGDGTPGPVALGLLEDYRAYLQAAAADPRGRSAE